MNLDLRFKYGGFPVEERVMLSCALIAPVNALL